MQAAVRARRDHPRRAAASDGGDAGSEQRADVHRIGTVRRVMIASVASAATTPAASAIDHGAGQLPTWIAAPGMRVTSAGDRR